MNEELKIVISAVTDSAKKGITEVSKSVQGLDKESKGASGGFKAAMGKVGSAAKVAAGAAVAAIAAIGAALVSLGNSTKEYREEQAKLNSAFQAMGSTAAQAGKTYNDLYRFMGESDTAVEAAGHLAKLTQDEKELAEWTTALQGVYATFGDSLPIEGLTEAANETAKVGKVTGGLADALNWAGVSEDAFNASLAAANSESERQALIRNTLNGLYSDAAALYEKNNAEMIAANEAQARLDATTGALGKTIQPFLTALTNLSNVLLSALAPAITVVSKAFTYFVNAISSAISYIMSFFGLLSGKGASSAQDFSGSMGSAAGSLGNAASGAGKLSSGLGTATKQAEKLKKVTAGFDELNILPSTETSSSGGGAAAGASGGVGGAIAPIGGSIIDTSGIDKSLNTTSKKFDSFVKKLKKLFKELQTAFSPTINAFKDLFKQLSGSFTAALPDFQAGFDNIKAGFGSLWEYLSGEFIPNVVNGYYENIAPIFADIGSALIEELGATTEFLGELFNSVANDILIPLGEEFEKVWVGTAEAINTAWTDNGGALLEEIQKYLEGVRDSFDKFYNNLILPIWEKIQEVFDKLWTDSLKPLVENVVSSALEIGTCIMELYNEFIKPIVDWIQDKIYPIIVQIFGWIVEKAGESFGALGETISGLVTVLKGIVQFITGVFTGDWKKAWEGVKNIFKGVWDAVVGVIKTPINLIIDGINLLLRGITTGVNAAIKAINGLSFTVPDWVPAIGGKKFGFDIKELTAPQIPRLATGGIVMGETLARIGEGGKKEMVLPLEQNTQWMDILADRIASRNNTPSKIVLMLDGNELGWANIHSINSITEQTGALQLII